MLSSSATQLPLGLLNAAQGHPMLVELKNGETLNGHLINCDTWMNLTLKEVVQTSPEGDKFFRLPEVYVRGNNVYLYPYPCTQCGLILVADQIPASTGRDHRPGQGSTAESAIDSWQRWRCPERRSWRKRRQRKGWGKRSSWKRKRQRLKVNSSPPQISGQSTRNLDQSLHWYDSKRAGKSAVCMMQLIKHPYPVASGKPLGSAPAILGTLNLFTNSCLRYKLQTHTLLAGFQHR